VTAELFPWSTAPRANLAEHTSAEYVDALTPAVVRQKDYRGAAESPLPPPFVGGGSGHPDHTIFEQLFRSVSTTGYFSNWK